MMSKIKKLLNNYKVKLKTSVFTRIITIVLICGLMGMSIILIKLNPNNQQKYYSIQFDTSGGTYIEPIIIKEGDVILAPINPAKEGFNFVEWQFENCKYEFTEPVNSDMIISAFWEKEQGVETVIITFDTRGGTQIQSIEVIKGGKIEKPAEPQMPGYEFAGWYKEFEKFDFSSTINEDITLRAKWINKKEQSVSTPNIAISNNEQCECSGGFRNDAPEKNVSVGYKDHVAWTWTTNGSYGTDCDVIYKTSNKDIAVVDENGIITTLKAGTVYIYMCIIDVQTKTEVACFKGKLNIIDENDNTTVLNKYDTIVNDYVGIWYLEGYEDVFITISKHKNYYESMLIMPTNVNISSGEIYATSYGSIEIIYSDWNKDIEETGVELGTNNITIKTSSKKLKFIRQKGTKTKYDGTMFKSSLGTWYLYNHPESYINIYSQGDESDLINVLYYYITSKNFDLNTFGTNVSNSWGCELGTSDSLFNKFGISISNDKLTINNGSETRTFYKTKKFAPVTGIELNKSNLNLFVGGTEKLVATIIPNDAYDNSCVWSSSNSNIVTVDGTGKVLAISEGTAIITVTTNDGKYSSKCNVTVNKIAVTGVALDKTELSLIKGEIGTLLVTISPQNATNKKLIWESNNPNIASVDNTGKITAKEIGTAVITVTTEDGDFTNQCTIRVKYSELEVDASIGYSVIASNSSIQEGISVSLKVSGGSSAYTHYYIKLYKDGNLIAESSTSQLFASGYKSGAYYVEYIVRDSAGNEKNGKSGVTTISM